MVEVDYSKPIEAVNEYGEVRGLTPAAVVNNGGVAYGGYVEGVGKLGFRADGSAVGRSPWRARNVVPPKHTYTVRPEDEAALLASDPLSRPTPDERAVAPELVKRMRKFIDRCVSFSDPKNEYSRFCGNATGYQEEELATEARAIVAALEPVDPDVTEAEAIMKTIGYRDIDPASDVLKVAVAALRRGRSLATSRDVTPCTREQFEEERWP